MLTLPCSSVALSVSRSCPWLLILCQTRSLSLWRSTLARSRSTVAPRISHMISLPKARLTVSISLDTDFCVEALREAIERHGEPTIFNTDQGVQFTSAAFIDELQADGIRISMDGKGAWQLSSRNG